MNITLAHEHRAKILRDMRREAGINQAVLAKLIGVCRETIINIEHCNPGAIGSISLDNICKWYQECKDGCSSKTKMDFKSSIAKMFDI